LKCENVGCFFGSPAMSEEVSRVGAGSPVASFVPQTADQEGRKLRSYPYSLEDAFSLPEDVWKKYWYHGSARTIELLESVLPAGKRGKMREKENPVKPLLGGLYMDPKSKKMHFLLPPDAKYIDMGGFLSGKSKKERRKTVEKLEEKDRALKRQLADGQLEPLFCEAEINGLDDENGENPPGIYTFGDFQTHRKRIIPLKKVRFSKEKMDIIAAYFRTIEGEQEKVLLNGGTLGLGEDVEQFCKAVFSIEKDPRVYRRAATIGAMRFLQCLKQNPDNVRLGSVPAVLVIDPQKLPDIKLAPDRTYRAGAFFLTYPDGRIVEKLDPSAYKIVKLQPEEVNDLLLKFSDRESRFQALWKRLTQTVEQFLNDRGHPLKCEKPGEAPASSPKKQPCFNNSSPLGVDDRIIVVEYGDGTARKFKYKKYSKKLFKIIAEASNRRIRIEKDRLNEGGDLIFNSKLIVKFGMHPYSLVSYEIVSGKVDKTSVVLYDENGKPRNNLRKIIDLKSGLFRGHLPVRVVMGLFKTLDNVRIENDRLNCHGHLCIGEAKPAFICQGYRYYPISYEIHNGKVDPATVIIYDKKERPVNSLRKIIDLRTGLLKGHLPEVASNKILMKLSNVRVEGDRLNLKGNLWLGGRQVICFSGYSLHPVAYEIYRGKVDLSSILVLDEKNRLVPGLRRIIDLSTGRPYS